MIRRAFLLALGLVLLSAPARAVEDPCAADGGTKVADTCDGYASSCCSLDRTVRYWCVTYGSNNDQKAACTAACGGATCGWKCDENPLTGECITYPVSLGSYRCGQAAAPDPTGDNAWTCKAFCSPACGGKNCGPDGCGPTGLQGVCGQCITDPQSSCPMACSAAGKCDKVCADCATLGWECGSNCCGGICGSCMPPSTCDSAAHTCSCVPSCAGKACGDDGCGGSCGGCAAGMGCQDGACVPLVADVAPDVADTAVDTGEPDPVGPRPDAVDVGPGVDTAPAADTSPVPDSAGAPDLPAAVDTATAADGGCPDGSSMVSGLCLKDPPKTGGGDGRSDGGGGGCRAGRSDAASLLAVLAALLGLLVARRAGERG